MYRKENLIADLIDMNDRAKVAPLVIDLVYADAAHPENIFKTALYKKEAHLYLHKDLAAIVEHAAHHCRNAYGWTFILKDGLRPIEAQDAMQHTPIVKANPHWMVEPRLLSPPGTGGHPRAMAIDITARDAQGSDIDMGTVFDYLSEDQDNNPAARDYAHFSQDILDNRQKLEQSMILAAKALGLPLLPLPQEWWDFRFPPDYSAQYPALSDFDLPEAMRICA